MATARLVPSAYSVSSTNYVTVTNPSNMYYNTDHTASYATLRGRGGRSSNSTYYAFIHGFNFSAVPSTASVSSFTILIRCYRNSYTNSSSTYNIRLASNTANNSVISNTTTSTAIGETVDNITIPTGSLSWATMSGYGANFSIEIPLRNTSTSSSNYPYVYVYGAEINVTYTEPTPSSDKIYFKNNGSWVEATNVYKKVNGVWQSQSDLTTVFSSGTNYVRGD